MVQASSDTRRQRELPIIVTGAAGFIGANLVERLLMHGHEVIGIDDLSAGSRGNLESASQSNCFRLIEADITSPVIWDALPAAAQAVVHLAAKKIPRYGGTSETLRVNYEGTRQALEYCCRSAAKLIFASTSDVYGCSPHLPFREDGDCVIGTSKSPRWAYAISKLFDEHLVLAYQDEHGVPVVILRYFGSYGPKQPLSWWGGAPPVFIEAVLNDKPITVHGDGSQTRCLTYIDDVIDATYAALIRPEAVGEIINIGSQFEISMLDLAKRIKALSNTPGIANIQLVPYESFTGKPYQDVMKRVPDTSLAKRVLDFEATITLDEGLTRTIKWQREAMARIGSSE